MIKIMTNLSRSNSFKKELKQALLRGKDIKKLEDIIHILQKSEKIPHKFKDHALVGNYKGFRELHIEPDWLLIYRIEGDDLILEATGTYSDLFW